MIDAKNLVDLLTNQWDIVPNIGTDPTSNVFLQIDEFNPRNPKWQLVLINRPAKQTFLCPNVIRIEQDILVELHLKLTRYDPDTVTNSRTEFDNIKDEVTRILNKYRFGYVGNTINMTSWIDSKLPHGFGMEAEPLEFISRLALTVIYYVGEDIIPPEPEYDKWELQWTKDGVGGYIYGWSVNPLNNILILNVWSSHSTWILNLSTGEIIEEIETHTVLNIGQIPQSSITAKYFAVIDRHDEENIVLKIYKNGVIIQNIDLTALGLGLYQDQVCMSYDGKYILLVPPINTYPMALFKSD